MPCLSILPMMKYVIAWKARWLSTLFFMICFPALAADPVVITVGTDTIRLSGFTAAYRHNVRDALPKISAGDFAKSYAVFRQKVCYARDCGIDTLQEFRSQLAYLSEGADTSAVARTLLADDLLVSLATERAVWKAAAADSVGMEKFYRARRRHYSWPRPCFKGHVVLARNDSVMQRALSYLDAVKCTPASVADSLDRHFHGDAYAWMVLAPEGKSAVIDYIAFGKPKPDEVGGRWHAFSPYGGRIIDRPEVASDVAEQLYPDWQAHVERKWLSDLAGRYPVKINKKLLKMVK